MVFDYMFKIPDLRLHLESQALAKHPILSQSFFPLAGLEMKNLKRFAENTVERCVLPAFSNNPHIPLSCLCVCTLPMHSCELT